jgi:hypothetical protein
VVKITMRMREFLSSAIYPAMGRAQKRRAV